MSIELETILKVGSTPSILKPSTYLETFNSKQMAKSEAENLARISRETRFSMTQIEEMNKRGGKFHEEIKNKWSQLYENNQQFLAYLIFLIPQVRENLKKTAIKVERWKYGLKSAKLNEMSETSYMFLNSRSVEKTMQLTFAYTDRFQTNNEAINTVSLNKFINTCYAARETVENINASTLWNLAITYDEVYKIPISPTMLTLSLAAFALEMFGTNDESYNQSIQSTPDKYGARFQDVGDETNSRHFITDYMGFSIEWPLDIGRESIKEAGAEFAQKVESQRQNMGWQTIINDLNKAEEFYNKSENLIKTYLEEISTDEQNVGRHKLQFNNQLNRNNFMVEEKFEGFEEEVYKAQTVNNKSEEIEKEIKSNYEQQKQITTTIMPLPQSNKVMISNSIQIKTALEYFDIYMQSYSEFKYVFPTSNTETFEAEVYLSILLTERRRRMNQTQILNFIGSTSVALKKMLLNVKEGSSPLLEKVIKKKQRELADLIELNSTLPIEQIKIMAEKGRRIRRQIELATSSNETTVIIEKNIGLIMQQTKEIFENNSFVALSIEESMKASLQQFDQLKQSFEENKVVLSNFSSSIESNMVDLYNGLATNISTSFKDGIQEFQQEISYLEGRLNIEFKEIKEELAVQANQLKKVLESISKIAQDITYIKTQITDLREATKSLAVRTENIATMVAKTIDLLENNSTGDINFGEIKTDLQGLKKAITEDIGGITTSIKKYTSEIDYTPIQNIKNSIETLNTGNFDQVIGKITKNYQTPSLDKIINLATNTYNTSSLENVIEKTTKPYNTTSLDTILNKITGQFQTKSLDELITKGTRSYDIDSFEKLVNIAEKSRVINTTTLDELIQKTGKNYDTTQIDKLNAIVSKVDANKNNSLEQLINSVNSTETLKTAENVKSILSLISEANKSAKLEAQERLSSLETLKKQLESNGISDPLETLPDFLANLVMAIKKLELQIPTENQNIHEKLDEMTQRINSLTKISFGSGSGDGDDEAQEKIEELLMMQSTLEDEVRRLKEFIDFLYRFLYDFFEQESEFANDFFNDMVKNKSISQDIADNLINQLITKHNNTLESLNNDISSERNNKKVALGDKKLLKSEYHEKAKRLEPFSWWDSSNKRIKF